MLLLRKLLTGILIFAINTAFAQVNFKKAWITANPVKPGAVMPAKNKAAIHAAYLKKAISEKNILHQLYGNLYLYEDNLAEQQYPEAASYLLAAADISNTSGNADWMGHVKVRDGWMAFLVHRDNKKAIEAYREALQLCRIAGDSVCIGRCLEQFGVLYANAKKFDSAHYYFNLAIPLFKKFPESNLGSVYNNYTNLLAYENRSAEGLIYIDSAIAVARQEQNLRSETIYLTNRGLLLGEVNRYGESIALLQKCAFTDLANGWLDNLVYDYSGLTLAYKETGDYKSAFDYTEKYHKLNDSLTGVSVNLKIAGLTAANKNQEKELLMKQNQLELSRAKNLLAKRTWIILVSGLLIAIILLGWFVNNRKNEKERLQNKADLDTLTRLLIDKNTALALLEQQLHTQPEEAPATSEAAAPFADEPEHKETPQEIDTLPENGNAAIENSDAENNIENNNFDNDIYNQRILTNEDSAAFKTYFEKAYPGYIRRLRTSFPGLTEAEERLFLFIKLNLKSKESAAILGISIDSVKKTRNRLRKRLALPEQIELEGFIERF